MKIFDFFLGGIAPDVRFGKGGPRLKASTSSIDIRLPDDSDFANARIADPQGPNDAVSLQFLRENVLLNWSTPVQTISALQAIPSIDRKDKQVREVEDEEAFYQFDAQSIAAVPFAGDPSRIILPNDISLPAPGRWIKSSSRAQNHSQLLGNAIGNDHPQYQLRSEKNNPSGFPGLSADIGNPGVEFVSDNSGQIVSRLRSLGTAVRTWFLPDKNGTLATDEVFTPATDSIAGAKGLVPGPAAGDQEKFLGADGTWKTNYGSLKNSPVQTSNYTALKYERVIVDCSSNSIVIALPSSPPDNAVVGILDVENNSGSIPIVITGNGINIEDEPDDWQLDLDGGYWELAFSSERNSWYFLEIPAYNNVAGAGNVSDSPSFTEVAIAPSARATKYLVDQSSLSTLQSILPSLAAQSGIGHAPTNTLRKWSWFEGITDSAGICIINTGLGANILAAFGYVSDALGKWFQISASSGVESVYYDDSGNISIQFASFPAFQNKNVRFMVEHK
ncbi:hypothetical protein EHO57_13945 [Leptospira langatensis]|uniref:Uncharacterized protein n=1 Tax=Leptospira langatensis TaxID=2484983 RepID=A0A5R2ASS5_9LEPT|nr:hypothetical protein [Leptospira langatensis]TGJ99858.1 hypothetical protein EHO57_13945 [Leptospira langatensis]